MMPGAPPPPPPPPSVGGGPPPPPPFGMGAPEILLPQTNTPKPRQKMKSLNWQKIPVNCVIGKSNLWTEVGSIREKMDNKVDYGQLEELFGVTNESSVKRRGDSVDGQSEGKRKKENAEINILDGKRSLNVNIFLKQFRMSYEEIVQLLRDGRREVFGAEKLKSLLKQLPSQEEIDALNAFDGDRERLGNPERFFLILMGLPNYRMRIEGLLVMEEYNANMEWIRPSIEAVIQAARDIQESETLKELIFLILVSGNYLNSGNYAGNAAGFKISSLLKLTELRANKPGMNLMHYVAQQAAEKKPKLLKFPEEMKFLKDASQVSVESLTADVTSIASKVRAITEQIVLAGRDFQQQMSIFLKEANIEVQELEEDLEEIEEIRQAMATYLCEDIKTFKLEEFFKVLQTFCDKLKKAHEENILRKIQEAKEEEKKNKRDADSRRNSKDLCEPTNHVIDKMSSEAKKGTILDELLADVRSGFTSSKLNEGNFSVTKVTKVNLCNSELLSILSSDSNSDDPLLIRGSFGRVSQRRRRGGGDSSLDSPGDGPSPTPDSAVHNQIRNGVGTGDDVSLTNILMGNEASLAAMPVKPETAFERYASLRRRRLERKQRKSSLEVFGSDRERAKSPSTAMTAGGIEHTAMRNGGASMSAERPKSDIEQDQKTVTLRRTRSLMDQSTSGGARRDLSSEDESEALINRLKQKLARKDGRTTPTSSDDANSSRSSNQDASTPISRTSSRWRSGITVSETNSPLESISEKNPTLDDFTTAEQTQAIQKTREKNSNRFRSSLDPTEVSRAMQTIEKTSAEDDAMKTHLSKDDSDMVSPQVSKSVRLKMSNDMGTNIDHLLKTIEDMGRPIDSVGVSGPIRRTPDPAAQKSPSQQRAAQPQVAVVAHITASNTPSTPFNENELKAKREMRKKRANISMDDVKAAMRLDPSSVNTVNNKNSNSNNNNNNSVSSSHTPPTPRRASPKTVKSPSDILKNDIKELSKAAKLAGKKKFRDARFGSSSATDSKTRARSNVEPDSVDKALKELINKNNMSRSKSFDEKVDENILTSGNKADTTQNNQAVSRSSLYGQRYGSSGQLSLKSANTSTETIPANVESSPEQIRKQTQARSSPRKNEQNSLNIQPPRPNSTTPLELGTSTLRRSYSLLDKSKYVDEESNDTNASIAKWRLKREKQRRSVYDNLLEGDSNNDAGSRSSYASSNDKDEGFETGSGSWSQRTSMSSTLETEMIAAQSRRADMSKLENGLGHTMAINGSVLGEQFAFSELSEETDRNARTQNWTEQAVRVNTKNGGNKDVSLDKSESLSALSPDSGLSNSKEDFWSEESSQILTPTKSKNDGKKTPSKESLAKTTKTKSVPSYMMPTSRSAARPASTTLESTFKRDTPSRTSVKERAVTPTLKRETTVRASMRAETSMASFQRGTIARTSVRGPRSSLQVPGTPVSTTEQPSASGRQRADSSASVSSRLSTSSSKFSTPNKTKLPPKTATPCHSAAARAAAVVKPTTASIRATSATKMTATPSQTSSAFSRTQSMRTPSTRAFLGADTKRNTPFLDSRRSITPLPGDTSRVTEPQLPERPHSTTPASISNRRSSFMAPTASSKARADEQTPVAPPRTKTLANKTATSTFTRHSSLRLPSRTAHELLSGPKSPATLESPSHHKPEHYKSLSTVTEQAGDEVTEEVKEATPKRSPSILQRIGRGSTKVAPAAGRISTKSTSAK